jgi:hypothetical protein
MRAALLLCALGAGAGACIEPGDRPATWDHVHAAIVAPSCATATCHSDLTERAELSLQDPDEAYDALLDGRYVVPGDQTSALMYLLEGDERVRMPPDAPLPAVDVALIRTWIVEGAAR